MLYGIIISFVLSGLLIYFLRYYASSFGLVDVPNERSIHHSTVARGGGIGFSLAVFIILYIFYTDFAIHHFKTILAIFLVFLIGVLDDLYDTSPNTKFFVIILSTFILSFDGICIQDLGAFFGYQLTLGWLAIPFTIFAVTGFTNALNLIDGIDGLAATLSLVILGVFLVIGYQYHDDFIIILSSLFIAGILAFIIFNWYPATIFMGDSGALTLGFIISILSIKSLAYIPTVSILFIAAVPILDTLVVMIRRKRDGRSIFSADKCHIHHIFRHFFSNNTPKTVLFLTVMQLTYAITGLQLDKRIDEGFLLILFLLNVVLLYFITETMVKQEKKDC